MEQSYAKGSEGLAARQSIILPITPINQITVQTPAPIHNCPKVALYAHRTYLLPYTQIEYTNLTTGASPADADDPLSLEGEG